MPSVTALHPYTESEVLKVMEEMRQLGFPTIRVVDSGNGFEGDEEYTAIEGTHRLEAAFRLGERVTLDEIDIFEEDEIQDLDLDGVYSSRPLDWVIQYVTRPSGKRYDIDELGWFVW